MIVRNDIGHLLLIHTSADTRQVRHITKHLVL